MRSTGFLLGLTLSTLCALLLTSCGSIEKDRQSDLLEATLSDYGAAIRWGYYDAAIGRLDPATIKGPVGKLENIRVTSYEVVQAPVLPDENKAIQVVRIDYLHEEVQQVRTLMDRQVWEYRADEKTWRLTTGLPKFK